MQGATAHGRHGGWRRCRLDKESEREFLEFVAARTHALFRMAYALTGNQQAAEDLLQSALATCAIRWRQINDRPEPYVRKVMYHEQVSWWRRRRRYTELSMAVVPDRAVEPDPSHDTVLKLTLHRALARLGVRQRAVLVLRYLEDLSVREVVGELADRAQPVNLGVRALATARRRRRARRTWTVAGAAAAVTAVIVLTAIGAGPWQGSLPAPGGSSPAVPRPSLSKPPASPGPLVFDRRVLLTVEGMDLVAYQSPHPNQPIAVVYSRTRRQYEEILYEQALPSPVSDVAVVAGQDLPPVGLLDLSTHKYQKWTVDAYSVSDPQWSPDGRRVLLSINDKEPWRNGFALVDPATGQVSRHWVDAKFDSYQYRFSWHPDGRHVVLALADRTNASEAEPDKVAALQLFTLDGKPDGTIRVRGSVDSPSSWSPDGRYVIAQGVVDLGGARVNQQQVFEVASGRLVTKLFPEGQAWWIDEGRILLRRYEVNAGGAALEVVDPAGRQLRSYLLPSELGNAGYMMFHPTR